MNVFDKSVDRAGFSWRNAVAALTGAALVFSMLLVFDRLVDQFSHLQGSLKAVLLSIAYILPPAAISLIAIVLLFRCKDDRAISRIALALVAVSLLCRVIWVSVFDSYQVNDFGYYLRCAVDVVRTGSPAGSSFCEGVYWKRSAVYTYPIVLLFGQSLLAVKLANVLLATLTSWIFFNTGRIIFGARVAAIGLAFFIWQPDLWYAMTLASHDIPGLFWLAVFYCLCTHLVLRLLSHSKRWISVVALSLCLGGAIFFLEFSRSYQYGGFVALVLYGIVHAGLIIFAERGSGSEMARFLALRFPKDASKRDRLKVALVHAVLLVVIPLGVYRLASAGFWRVWEVQPGHGDSGLICYLSLMDVLGTSNYEEINNWYDRQCPQIPSSEKTAFAIRKVLHDVTHDPHEFLRHLQRKNRVLGHDDDYIDWSTYAQYEIWDTTHDQVRRINRSHLQEQYRAAGMAAVLVLALLLWRLLLYPGLAFRLSELIPLSFSGMYYLMFLYLVESQPRYDIYLAFPFSWMAAQAVEDLRRRMAGGPVAETSGFPHARRRLYLGGTAILAVLLSAYWGTAVLIADSSLTLRDQSGFATVPSNQVLPEARKYPQVAPVFVRNSHKQLMLAYPAGVTLEADSIVAAQRTFTVKEKASHHLRFFISTYSVREEPFDKLLTWEDTDLEYLVAVNGRIIASGNLNAIRDNRYLSLYPEDGLVFAPRMTVQIIVRNTEKIEKVEPNRGPIMSLEYIDLQ
jgi:hypothetical protein